jgi:hypothetical protein
MHLKEVAGHAHYEVLSKFDDNRALIVGDPLGILGQRLRPHPAH